VVLAAETACAGDLDHGGASHRLIMESGSVVYPGLILGDKVGDDAHLTVSNGIFRTIVAHAGMVSGSTAELVVGAGGLFETSQVFVGPGGQFVISDGGTICPGNSPGTLTVEGKMVLVDGAIYDWQCSAEGMDIIDVNGALVLPDLMTISLTDLEGNALPDEIILFTFDTCTGSMNLSGWSITGYDGGEVGFDGNSVVVTPEPATLGFMLAGVLCFLRRRKIHNR